MLFNPVRYINRNEHEVTTKVANTEQTKALVVMTPSQADGVNKLPAPAAAKPAEPEPEPTKRASKKADAEPTGKQNLANVVAAWSNEG